MKQVKRLWKCTACGAIIDHFLYLYDSTPNGEDESVCPVCRSDYGFTELKEGENG